MLNQALAEESQDGPDLWGYEASKTGRARLLTDYCLVLPTTGI